MDNGLELPPPLEMDRERIQKLYKESLETYPMVRVLSWELRELCRMALELISNTQNPSEEMPDHNSP